jgi:hypothetical protein
MEEEKGPFRLPFILSLSKDERYFREGLPKGSLTFGKLRASDFLSIPLFNTTAANPRRLGEARFFQNSGGQ